MADDDELPPFARRLSRTRSAIAFAAPRHACQRRESDASPFLLHPLEVASLLASRGYGDDVIAAGVLHDVLERTATSPDELRRAFGDRITELVSAVSEDDAILDYDERKAALRAQVRGADRDVHGLYAADKVAKARELRALAARGHVTIDDPSLARRLAHYEASHQMLEASGARGSALVEQLGFELWALRRLPPA